MPFEIVRNDIVKMQVDAIVNTANPQPIVGDGVDRAIHKVAGVRLLQARQALGDIPVGESRLTPAFDLPAKYVIHSVGPFWRDGTQGEAELLKSAYLSALKLAAERGCASIAFPLMGAGSCGFPKTQALRLALEVFGEFLMEQEMQIFLVVFHKEAFRLSEQLMTGIRSFVDQHYVDEAIQSEYLMPRQLQRRRGMPMEETACAPAPKAMSLEDMLRQQDAGFTERLLQLIDKTGKKDSDIYKKANLSKQHFSKIRNNPQYRPTKTTALALAIALELDLRGVRDLIGRAGYALTDSSKFDLIVRYFIQQGNYNIMEINLALYEFDQPLLG